MKYFRCSREKFKVIQINDFQEIYTLTILGIKNNHPLITKAEIESFLAQDKFRPQVKE